MAIQKTQILLNLIIAITVYNKKILNKINLICLFQSYNNRITKIKVIIFNYKINKKSIQHLVKSVKIKQAN